MRISCPSMQSVVRIRLPATGKMPENISSENLINNIMETMTEGAHAQNQKSSSASGSFFQEEVSNQAASQFNRLFGRQEPIHKVLGGGKRKCRSVSSSCAFNFVFESSFVIYSATLDNLVNNQMSFAYFFPFVRGAADCLLWRNKKISSSVLAGATAIWVMFEWLNYHFLSLVCFAVAFGMLAQFLWSNASGVLNRSPSKPLRIQIPDEWFVNIGVAVGREVNRVLGFLQNVACSGNLKQFIMVVIGLVVAAMIGGWVNFLTLVYIGFVAAHTLPVLYEKYDDQIDAFVENLLGRVTHHYKNIDARVLSKMPTRNWGKKQQ